MHPSVVFAALLLSASFVNAQCPRDFTLTAKDGKCVCKKGTKTVHPDSKCVFTLSPNGKTCHPICPSHAPSPSPSPSHKVKREQLLMNEDGSIANCPARTISCPIDAIMNMGFECISPQEDLDNCGGCVALGQGVSCERVAGVRKTECSRGRCINHSCRSGWVLDKRSNNCIPRPRRNGY
ncbi:hypothetical protein BYT27DRAFT_7242952 [Phlegmacium glaucopus]|nr:hypothetical protein BYT27DRAFT_7242952 [Phlegmacium glaucopus]